MTIVKARELIGKEGEKLSDEEVQETIEIARLLADIFLDRVTSKSKFGVSNNKKVYVKT